MSHEGDGAINGSGYVIMPAHIMYHGHKIYLTLTLHGFTRLNFYFKTFSVFKYAANICAANDAIPD